MERAVRLPKGPELERRASLRFPLALEVRYSVSRRRRQVATGSGHVIDMSSSGLRFAIAGPLEPGLKLNVSIDWPVLLDGCVLLQLIVTGGVVWSSGTETALQIERAYFKTRSAGLKVASNRESEGPSVANAKAVNANTVWSLLPGRPTRTG